MYCSHQSDWGEAVSRPGPYPPSTPALWRPIKMHAIWAHEMLEPAAVTRRRRRAWSASTS